MAFSKEQAERYARHFVLKEIGVSGQKRLLQSSVLVIGAGALGSGALLYLAAAGVGVIGIADGDRVELSNLGRQVIHRQENLGILKTESAKRVLQELNPDITIQTIPERVTPDNIESVIAPYDFVLDCTDRFETKFLINDACVLMEKPYSHAGAVRFEGQAMTYVPRRGGCLRCVLGSVPENAATCAEAGVLGTIPGMLGCIQATEAIKFLLGAGELLTGRVLHIDGITMRTQTIRIGKAREDCPVCGKGRSSFSLSEHRAEYEPACSACFATEKSVTEGTATEGNATEKSATEGSDFPS